MHENILLKAGLAKLLWAEIYFPKRKFFVKLFSYLTQSTENQLAIHTLIICVMKAILKDWLNIFLYLY